MKIIFEFDQDERYEAKCAMHAMEAFSALSDISNHLRSYRKGYITSDEIVRLVQEVIDTTIDIDE